MYASRFLFFLLLIIAHFASGQVTSTFSENASYTVCFTPKQNCEGLIVSEIDNANSSIFIQAYSFTSTPIAKALVQAHKRGVLITVILDKSQKTEKYSGATFLKNAGIKVFIDNKPKIAHSKIMIFDQNTVLTGSYNFTKAAQERNSENIIFIRGDKDIAKAYISNFVERHSVSRDYE